MHRSGNSSEEIDYLYKEIDAFIKDIMKKVRELKAVVPEGNREEAMAWISENVDNELAPYVRMAYLGTLSDDAVSKKYKNKYMSINAIGIPVSEDDFDVNKTEK